MSILREGRTKKRKRSGKLKRNAHRNNCGPTANRARENARHLRQIERGQLAGPGFLPLKETNE